MSLSFEWNKVKAEINLKKHGIGFEEAKTVFYDILAKTFLDKDNSKNETRFILIGFSKNNRLLFISYTDRNDIIRIISARKATKNERYNYEKNY